MTLTTHLDTWPCDGPCELCYPLSGRPDMEADAQRKLDEATAEVDAKHGRPDPFEVMQLAAIIRKVDGKHTLGAAALAEAILVEWQAVVRPASTGV